MRAWQGVAAVAAAAALGCTEAMLDLRLVPGDGDFGAVAVGATSTPQQFALSNSGPEATQPLSVELSGDAAAELGLPGGTCAGQSLPVGGSCGILATITPASKGLRRATLTVRSGSSSASMELQGTGVDPAILRVTPPANPHDYGAILAGGPGQTAVFVASNDGGVTSSAITLSLAGADASMFSLGANRCFGQSLGPGANCSFEVAFQPPLSATGSYSATLVIAGSLSLGLVGTALHSAALAWSPPSHDYGARQVGLDDASGDFTFQLSNQGNLDSSAIALTNLGNSDFSVRLNTCTSTLPPGTFCTVTVRFVPLASGARSGSVVATASQGAPGPTGVAVTLDGTGQ